MRKIVAGLFVSLDGVVEAPEEWTGPYFNDEVGQEVDSLMAEADTMLLGGLPTRRSPPPSQARPGGWRTR